MVWPGAEDAPTVEAWLVEKIRRKNGLHHLSLDEIAVAQNSKIFAQEWRRQSGEEFPEKSRAVLEFVSIRVRKEQVTLLREISWYFQ